MSAFPLAAGGVAPGWLVLAAAVVAAAGLLVLLLRAQSFRLPALALLFVGLLVVAYGLVLLNQQKAEQRALRAEEQAIEARATSLDGALAASGLACMDALADMATGCEPVVFARPETVAAARALVRARLMLLRDADALSRRFPASELSMRMAAWREPLARDPYGLVAVVLREDFSCTDDPCAPARLLGEGTKAAASMADRRFETLYAARAARWKPAEPEAEPAAPAAPSVTPPVSEPASPPESAEPPARGEEAPIPTAAAPLPPPRPMIPSIPRPLPMTPRPVVPQPAPIEEPSDPAPGLLQ